MKIEILHHATIKLTYEKVIYLDPYDIKEEFHDADYIFITHEHYDHYDEESIKKVRNENTKIVVPKCLEEKENDLVVEPNKEYRIDNLSFKTIPSYNIGKSFHPKEKEYVGYNLLIDGVYYYIMGDTNRTPESDKVKTDVCFVPIGGIYTMDVEEAVSYINDLNPKKAIPIHYGKIVGDISLGEEFKDHIKDTIEVELLIERENQNMDNLREQLKDAHMRAIFNKNNPEQLKTIREEIRKIRKKIAREKINESKERGK